MSKKFYLIMALLVMTSMVLAACGGTAAPAEPAAKTIKACQVTDVGGIDDKSFNATAWKGMEDAAADLGVEVKYLESQNQSDYEVNLNAFVEDGCDVIISAGFMLADATNAAAATNPNVNYGIIDSGSQLPNLLGNASQIDQATFLAGYLAAGMTKTGKVATYTGILFPATQVFMDGFAMGVAKYNEVHGTDVQVLGWDMATQTGLEVGNFESLDDGRALGESLLDEGADIILPVAGPVGLGTLAVMKERGTGLVIGVDNDWAVANPGSADFILASALKNTDVFVYNAIKATKEGNFKGGETFMLSLTNSGVGLVYSSAWDAQVPAELKAEIEALIPQIISGEVPTLPTR